MVNSSDDKNFYFDKLSSPPAATPGQVPLVSQEVLNDLSRETALIHASEEKANDSGSGETYDFFWFISLSIRVSLPLFF